MTTNPAPTALTIHDVIDDLCRQARAIAPKVADQSLDAGCTNDLPVGPLQREAFRLVRSAFDLNAISDGFGADAEAGMAECWK